MAPQVRRPRPGASIVDGSPGPRPEVVEAREANRAKTGYAAWSAEQLDRSMREETPRLGLWIDSSEQTPEQTVEKIVGRAWEEAAVDGAGRELSRRPSVPKEARVGGADASSWIFTRVRGRGVLRTPPCGRSRKSARPRSYAELFSGV